MILNYLHVALRHLKRNKSYVIINTLGMGISIACCITAYFLVAYNIEFDNFHDDEKVSRIFNVNTLGRQSDGSTFRDVQAPMVLPPIASQEIAGIERYSRFLHGGGALSYHDKAFNETVAFADSAFFDLFDFPLSAGNKNFFYDRDRIFLSKDIAEKYFGTEDPVGKLIVFTSENGTEIELLVGGVLDEFPVNNSFFFKILIRIEHYIGMHKIKSDDWSDWRNPSILVELSSAGRAAQVSEQLSKYIPNRNRLRPEIKVESYQLVPFKTAFSWDDVRLSRLAHRRPTAWFISTVLMAGFILVIACFNLMNTTIALAGRRLKEIGVRKAVGARRRQIVLQFSFETFLLILISMPLGLLMAQVLVQAYVRMWGMLFNFDQLDDVNFIIAMVILVFLTSLAAGIYPALYSSNLKPTVLLRGMIRWKGSNGLTKTMTGLQFTLSVVAMVAGIAFVRNLQYQERIKFGYDYQDVMTVTVKNKKQFEAIHRAISINPKILSVSASHGTLGGGSYLAPVQYENEEYRAQVLPVGQNFFKTMGLEFIEGRAFNFENASDVIEGVVVNRAFVALAGFDEAVDKVVVVENVKRRILGVIENHIDNLFRSKEAEPFVFFPLGTDQYNTLLVKAQSGALAETQDYLEATWKKMFYGEPFESRSQSDILLFFTKRMNVNMGKMALFTSVLGGLLCASGIFALASLNVRRRRKEIGVRKTLGASVNDIVALMNREFVIILVLACIAGSVGGYYTADSLLSAKFTHRIDVGVLPIIISVICILSIGIFTTSITIFKAARANPVNSLRSE